MAACDTLCDIAAKVEAGIRLDYDDGARLFESRDLHEIGRLADIVRQRKNGRVAWYVLNRHINYTNVCVLRCKFCSFYRPHGGEVEGGYTLSVDEVVEQALRAYEGGATEVHIVGGLHPTLPLEYYVDMMAGVRAACPEIHIKAFTAIEIIHFSRIARPRLTIAEVLRRLRAGGLDSLPGGGAEIFDARVQAEAFDKKVGEAGWFDVHRTAHEMGIPSTATMLFGHVETPAERVGHLIKLRRHQDASMSGRRACFQALVPLPFIPAGSALSHLPGPSGITTLKTLAISRLMLDNVAHIKAFWPMLSPKVAQVSLDFGVDDLDGTVGQYDVTHRDGAPTEGQYFSVEALRRLIIETRRIPVQRDSVYRPMGRSG
jgi:aminodeoxyfutalosine synthase